MPGEGAYAGLEPGKAAEEYYALLPGPARRRRRPGPAPAARDRTRAAAAGCRPGRARPGRGPAGRRPTGRWPSAQAERAAAGRGPAAGRARAGRRGRPAPAGRLAGGPAGVRPAVARNDYSWARPNRRFVAQGLYLPGLHSEELGDVVLAVDTSGSIGERVLGVFAAEANAVLARFDCTVTVLYHDTEVQKVQTWHSADGPLVLDPVGGGGTSHACVFDWLEQVRPGPGLRRLPDRPGHRVPAGPAGRARPVGRRGRQRASRRSGAFRPS